MIRGRAKEGMALIVCTAVRLCDGMEGSIIKADVSESKVW